MGSSTLGEPLQSLPLVARGERCWVLLAGRLVFEYQGHFRTCVHLQIHDFIIKLRMIIPTSQRELRFLDLSRFIMNAEFLSVPFHPIIPCPSASQGPPDENLFCPGRGSPQGGVRMDP